MHRLDGLWLGDAFLQHYGLKLLDDLTVLHDLLYKTWLHHPSIVGNGIVEGYSVNWRNLRLITNAHPGESGLTPVFRAVGSLSVRHSDHRWMIAHDRNLQILVDTDTVETLNIFPGVMTIIFINEVADTDVRADLQGASHINRTVAATSPVVILHRPAMHLHHTTARWNGHGGVDGTVIKRYEEGGYLKH